MAGRAGRPKYDKYGEAVLIAKTEHEKDALVDHYVLSEPEEIFSKLKSQSALRSHLLAAIATELTNNREEVDELISSTFFASNNEQYKIDHHVSSAIEFLIEGQLVETTGSDLYTATALGRRASRLYIDPQTAIMFRDILSQSETHTIFGMLHMICHTPDQPVTYVARSEIEDTEVFIEDHFKELMVEPPDELETGYTDFLGEVKTARILQEWISETTEKDITERYNVGMGDVHRFVQSAEWLIYAASEIARITDNSGHIPSLRGLRSRLKYGVRADILELVGLRGIGRVRGRMLHNQGLFNLTELYQVPIVELARIPTIGTSIAESIKKQLGVEVKSTSTHIEPVEEVIDDFDSVQTLLEDFSE